MTATHRSLLALAAGACLSVAAQAAPLTEAQNLAMKALELEFDVHRVTGTPEDRSAAFKQACEAGYNLACQRGAWVVYGDADLSTAADLFGSACDSGDSVACMVVGWHLDRSAATSSDRDSAWRSAARIFRDQCDSGFMPACHDWGWFLYQNKGFKADPRAGVQRWKKACDEGEFASCATLGTLSIEGGAGLPKNSSAASSWLDKACKGGFADACFRKGELEGAKWSPEKKDEWYGAQCDAGHRDSCWTLSQTYLSGQLPPPSEARLDALLDRGCATGSALACHEAGRREMAREKVDFQRAHDLFAKACSFGELTGCTSQVELITSEKIEGSVKTAPQAFESACLKRNSPVACTELAMELMRGIDLPRDPTRARALLHRSCFDADSAPRACLALGESYADGNGGPRDRTTAAKYYRWACDKGTYDACERRGDLLVDGRGITRDDHDALAMFTKACDGGRPEACFKAATILDEATFVKRDIAKAAELYARACETGSGRGCYGKGRMLEAGSGGESDLVGARGAFERGAELGSVDAIRELARMLWSGLGGKKSRRQARSLAAEACQKGDVVACRGAEAL